eukprot:s2128_g2.t1
MNPQRIFHGEIPRRQVETQNLLNEIARVTVDSLNTKAHNQMLKDRHKQLSDELAEREKLIEQYEQEIRKRHHQIEKKQLFVDRLNREYDEKRTKLEAEIGNDEDVAGPQEAKLKHMRKAIAELTKECSDMQKVVSGALAPLQDWIQKQTQLLSIASDTDKLKGSLNENKNKKMVLEQKKIRIEGQLSGHEKEIRELENNMKHLRFDMDRMNGAVVKNESRSDEISNSNQMMETEFVQKLKEIESRCLDMERDVEKLRLEKDQMNQDILESERQVLLWERKITLEKEMQAALDPNVGQADAAAMKKEIHRMELRLEQLKRRQEQMIVEMERAIHKRDVIALKLEPKAKKSKQAANTANVKRQLQSLRNNLKLCTQANAEAEQKITERQRDLQDLQQTIEQAVQDYGNLERANEALRGEVQVGHIEKQRNLASMDEFAMGTGPPPAANIQQQLQDQVQLRGKVEEIVRRGTALREACPVRNMANCVDPSSTDKGAADETDEVELQVLCLNGEGVTFSVNRSMLGSDLRRLVSDKLPCKPGAKLVVHHMNGALKLDENLAEQGIIGKSGTLSCTYIPTNVYTAWLYACGSASELLNCEREFALEGVTHLEGDTHPEHLHLEYLHHLPSSLASMTFGRHFNQSLERVTLPSGLQSLSFGSEFNQSLERVTLPSQLQSLSFGASFNQSLERVTLPSGLQSLSFGARFNQSLERVTLPSGLQSLSFGARFNQSLERVTLPSSLQSLSFDNDFNQSLERVTLPSSLQSLSFGFDFNQSLERVTLPSSLQSLSFGFDFSQSLERVTLPSSLQSLSFGARFNQSLERVTLPSSLQSLSFGNDFNQSLERVTLPSSRFGAEFNQSLERVTFPSSLQSLSFGSQFNQRLERVTLPSSLQSLSFGARFNQSLDRVTLPSKLQSLSFGFQFNQSLERVTLPASLQSLTFGFQFNQSLERVTLPSSLQSLSFGARSNESLERVTLPSSLQSLSFGFRFNQSLERVTLPSSLQSLSFGNDFNRSLERVTLPSSLQSLSFGSEFNQSLERVTLPSGLQSLSFGARFNQSLERGFVGSLSSAGKPLGLLLHLDGSSQLGGDFCFDRTGISAPHRIREEEQERPGFAASGLEGPEGLEGLEGLEELEKSLSAEAATHGEMLEGTNIFVHRSDRGSWVITPLGASNIELRPRSDGLPPPGREAPEPEGGQMLAVEQDQSKPSRRRRRSQGDKLQDRGEKKPKYRQAKEVDGGVVEVLCFSCRRAKDSTIQKSMVAFLKKAPEDEAAVIDLDSEEDKPPPDLSICARCRRPLWKKNPQLKPTADALRGVGELPQLQRLRAYRRTAERQNVPFTISEKSACAMMRSPCVGCGQAAPLRGHGLTRLRRWGGLERPKTRTGFMGPYAEENLAPACSMCNMMKGYRKLRGFVECCRHIATKHTEGEDFGEYPQRFRDNVSKRSRSCYITQSSTHTKTHSLTNEQFNAIVAQRCFYCHKEPRKAKTNGPNDRGHFNGLDRLDSKNRVYSAETSVAACGDCNIMKYKWDLEDFLEHCRKVARFHQGTDLADSDAEEVEEAAWQSAIVEELCLDIEADAVAVAEKGTANLWMQGDIIGYTDEVQRRRNELEQKMAEDFARLKAWRAQSGTEGKGLVEELEALYGKVRQQDKEIKNKQRQIEEEQAKVAELNEAVALRDRKWDSLAQDYCLKLVKMREEIVQRGSLCSWLQCAFDEIRFKWKAAEEKEKLKIEHHQRMRKARAQARLEVISRERQRRLLQACVLSLQEETVEGRQAKHLAELRRRHEDEVLVFNAQLAQALGDEEKAKELVAEQTRRRTPSVGRCGR